MKVIFTDPCYLVPKDKWTSFLGIADEERCFPVKYGKSLVIHKVSGTGVGDCGYEMGDGRSVCCDAGMFCIAQVSDSLAKEQKYGKFFDTVRDALENWDLEMERCVRGSEFLADDEDYCPHCGRSE